MRILVFSQYFTPEVGAPSTRLHSFAAGLAARGHDVEVICEVPNHPQGVVQQGYRRRVVRRQRLDGFRGAWLWVRTSPEKSTRDRLAFYCSYAAMASMWGASVAKPDVVFASSPPLPVGAAGCVVARRHRVPFVLDVRDLWPSAAMAVGELSGGRSRRLAEGLERFLYRDAKAITTVTRPFVRHIAEVLGSDQKIVLVPNGTTQFWLDAAKWEPDRSGVGFADGDFLWTFAGNVGLAQGLDTAVEAARLLGTGFKLVIVGDGALRPSLQQHASRLPAGTVEFRDQVPQERAARILRASDALLVSLSPDPALRPFVPSKLFDFCALGRPVILAANGEPQRMVDGSGAALPVPAGDSAALAGAVRMLRDRPDVSVGLAAAGRRFAAEHLRDQYVSSLESTLAGALARGGRMNNRHSPVVPHSDRTPTA